MSVVTIIIIINNKSNFPLHIFYIFIKTASAHRFKYFVYENDICIQDWHHFEIVVQTSAELAPRALCDLSINAM